MGIIVLNEDAVKVVNFVFIMFWMTANGVLSNLSGANWFITFMGKISPLRFICEGML